VVTRYLVTTADERTWKFDRPVLFLGEWCRLYERRQVWSGMNATVAEPYGLHASDKERDLAYVESLSTQLLVELADALNAFHGTRHGLRYWNILIGHWVRRYVAITFNRYFTLEQTLKNHEVLGTTILYDPEYSLATNNSSSSIWASNDDVWNHVLYAHIITFCGNVQTETQRVTHNGAGGFRCKSPDPASMNATYYARRAAKCLLQQFSRQRDAVIAASYLPPMEAVKLQLSMGQCPQLWSQDCSNDAAIDSEQRGKLHLAGNNHTPFEQFVSQWVSDALPTCYLEGYQQLVDQAGSLPWPSEPKFIFTSNRFDTDEVFKAWTGSMVEQGVPYFVGQHGNNYGTLLETQYTPELYSCDKFFTWGWTNDSHRNVPAFVFKIAGRTPRLPAPGGGLLLIELRVPHRATPWDSYFEFGTYQDEQFRFVEALPGPIQNNVTVRLHSGHRTTLWSDERRWKDRRPDTHIDLGTTAMEELIAQSRLVVHSYDSTGILETLAMNIPTLCFWNGGFTHLLPTAKPYYDLLEGAGIYLNTPEQAAEHVALHWDDIREWWESEKVQTARVTFCDQYARTAAKPIQQLKRLLNEACLEHTCLGPITGSRVGR
jgi:putative transferase (TIGR04331 family)